MKCMAGLLVALVATVMGTPLAAQQLMEQTIEYNDGDTTLQGFIAWDGDVDGERPGVLVVHEWWGLNDYAKQRARELAQMGYVAFAVDMYGDARTTEHPQEAGQWSGMVRRNVAEWRRRALVGLEVMRARPEVADDQVAAIGYCFGGATVLQLAYADAGLRGVVSFHGALPLPQEGDAEKLDTSILICHGNDDAFIPAEQIAAIREALDARQADWQMAIYAHARHGFTNPGADDYGLEGLRYNELADQRSWNQMQAFFDEIFAD